MSIMQKIDSLTKPNEIDAALRQLLSDEALPADKRAKYEARFEANIPAYNAWAALQQNAKGAVDTPAATGMPAVQPPQASPAPGGQPASASPDSLQFKTPEDVKAAFKAGKISREKARQILLSKHGFQQ